MTEQMKKIGVRYNELRAQGKSGKEAVEIIRKELQTDLPDSTIRKYASMITKQKTASLSEQAEHKESKAPKVKTEQAEPSIASLAERITAIEGYLQTMQAKKQSILDIEDMPPEPQVIKGEGKGRRENRDYQKVSLTIDKILWAKFCQERDRRRVSSGRLMDAILWNRYGRPKLSYEDPTD